MKPHYFFKFLVLVGVVSAMVAFNSNQRRPPTKSEAEFSRWSKGIERALLLRGHTAPSENETGQPRAISFEVILNTQQYVATSSTQKTHWDPSQQSGQGEQGGQREQSGQGEQKGEEFMARWDLTVPVGEPPTTPSSVSNATLPIGQAVGLGNDEIKDHTSSFQSDKGVPRLSSANVARLLALARETDRFEAIASAPTPPKLTLNRGDGATIRISSSNDGTAHSPLFEGRFSSDELASNIQMLNLLTLLHEYKVRERMDLDQVAVNSSDPAK